MDKVYEWYIILLVTFVFSLVMGWLLRYVKKNCFIEYLLVLFLGLGIAAYNVAVLEVLGGVQCSLEDAGILGLNILSVFIVWIVLYRLFKRLYLSIGITNSIFLILGLINHYYFEFRGEPFEITLLAAAGTALTVLDEYLFTIDFSMIIVFITETILNVMVFTGIKKKKVNISVLPKCIMESIVLWSIIALAFNMPNVSFFGVAINSETYGYLYSFAGYFAEAVSPLKPENYDKNQVEMCLDEWSIEEENTEKTPDIIVVMSEAFSDLPTTYGFETSQDGMPFYHSLKENTISGELLVSVYGGSTVNTEYEFLTGNSMAFMKRGSIPYAQYIRDEQQSLAAFLGKKGYDVLAYHPFEKTGYARDVVYPLLGLEQNYFIDADLPSNEILRWCTSDQSDFENVIYLYEKSREENGDKPIFLFNVTMQNHGGYKPNECGIEPKIEPVNEEIKHPQLIEYLTLVRESDRALEFLVRYFEQVDRDVIFLIFGDHQPGLEKEALDKMFNGLGQDSIDGETKQAQYKTSYKIWANFDIEEKEDYCISANYLRPMLLQAAGCELSSYDRYLLDVMRQYPAMNASGYYDAQYNWHNWSESNAVLEEYSWVQYYNAFDKKNMEERYFQ